ncbi:MAG TPA: hypothetical protein VGO57_19190 [Verrucomicrobiae bacterium]|jgi:hypothetical protein
MKPQVALIATVIVGVSIATIGRAATNDISSITLSPPKASGIGQIDSALRIGTIQPSKRLPVLKNTSKTDYSLQILKPAQGTNYCLHVATPAAGTNYFIRKLP